MANTSAQLGRPLNVEIKVTSALPGTRSLDRRSILGVHTLPCPGWAPVSWTPHQRGTVHQRSTFKHAVLMQRMLRFRRHQGIVGRHLVSYSHPGDSGPGQTGPTPGQTPLLGCSDHNLSVPAITTAGSEVIQGHVDVSHPDRDVRHPNEGCDTTCRIGRNPPMHAGTR